MASLERLRLREGRGVESQTQDVWESIRVLGAHSGVHASGLPKKSSQNTNVAYSSYLSEVDRRSELERLSKIRRARMNSYRSESVSRQISGSPMPKSDRTTAQMRLYAHKSSTPPKAKAVVGLGHMLDNGERPRAALEAEKLAWEHYTALFVPDHENIKQRFTATPKIPQRSPSPPKRKVQRDTSIEAHHPKEESPEAKLYNRFTKFSTVSSDSVPTPDPDDVELIQSVDHPGEMAKEAGGWLGGMLSAIKTVTDDLVSGWLPSVSPSDGRTAGKGAIRHQHMEEMEPDSAQAFIATLNFKGSRTGSVFKLGPLGLGYYRDVPPSSALSYAIIDIFYKELHSGSSSSFSSNPLSTYYENQEVRVQRNAH